MRTTNSEHLCNLDFRGDIITGKQLLLNADTLKSSIGIDRVRGHNGSSFRQGDEGADILKGKAGHQRFGYQIGICYPQLHKK